MMVIKKIEYDVVIILLFPQVSPISELSTNFEKEIRRNFKQKTHFDPLIAKRYTSIADINVIVQTFEMENVYHARKLYVSLLSAVETSLLFESTLFDFDHSHDVWVVPEGIYNMLRIKGMIISYRLTSTTAFYPYNQYKWKFERSISHRKKFSCLNM